jgi:lipopolysaccharide transport system permease protein
LTLNSERPDVENVIDPAKRGWIDLKELWTYRELFYFFAWRDIKIRYKQTVLGFLWVILQPLLMMLILTFFFGRALNIPSRGLPYPVYVFSGLLIWNFFSSGVNSAANSMVNNSTIIKKVYFPRFVIPVSSLLVGIVDFAVAFVIFALVLIYYQQPIHWNAIYMWPLAMIAAVMATLGLGCWLSALNVKYRDFRYVIPFLVQVLFFVTPVIYPIEILHHPLLQYLLAASPVYLAVELFRVPLTGAMPGWSMLLPSIASGIFIMISGLVYFRRTEDYFADFA